MGTRANISLSEEFEILDYSDYSTPNGNTTSSAMGRTPGVEFPFGLSTQRHLDIRTFNDGAVYGVNENWSGTGTFAVGKRSGDNHWPGLSVTLTSGTASTVTSTMAALDLTQLGDDANITLALPGFSQTNMAIGSCFLNLSDGTNTAALSFSSSMTSLSSGVKTATWPLSLVTGIDLTSVATVSFTFLSTASATVSAFGLRLMDPNWVNKDNDFDDLNGCLRQCIPLDGGVSDIIPNNQRLPQLWRSAPVPGVDDPEPIDKTMCVMFNTGSQTGINAFTLSYRLTNGTQASGLDLDGQMQVQLDGPQPTVINDTLLPRPISDFDNQSMGMLDLDTMINLDATPVSFTQSFIFATVQWGTIPMITLGRNDAPSEVYQWGTSQIPNFVNNTSYMAMISLLDTTFRIQIYTLQATTLAISSLFFDTGPISDSYQFDRHRGQIGWQATFTDGDAVILSIRPSSLVFAEWQSAPLNSITPVKGARVYAQYAPHIQLFQDFAAVPGDEEGIKPNLVLDTAQSISGQSYRLDVTAPSDPGQGVISNVLTPAGDPISGIVDFANTEIEFSLWFPSAALAAGGGLSAYLLRQTGEVDPLTLPRIIPDQWQSIVVYPPTNLQPSRYQLGFTYTGDVATSFWLDEITVNERTITWSARPSPTEPWTPMQDIVNNDSSGVIFPEYGSSLQVRAQAHRQDAAILGAPKIVPVYAPLGRLVWPEDVLTDPYAPPSGGSLGMFQVFPSSITHGSTLVIFDARHYGSSVTYNKGNIILSGIIGAAWYQSLTNGNTGHTPPNGTFWNPIATNPIISYQWSFGDGTSVNGDLVQHVFAAASPSSGYPVSLTTIDTYGTTTTTTINVVVS